MVCRPKFPCCIAESSLPVDRFSSESDVGEKAKIVVDKLREVKDE